MVLFSATEGNGDEVEPGLKPITRLVLLLGESTPGEPSLSELSLGIRWGTILPMRGDDGPALGICCADRGKCARRGEGVGEVVVMTGGGRGVLSPLPLWARWLGVVQLMISTQRAGTKRGREADPELGMLCGRWDEEM